MVGIAIKNLNMYGLNINNDNDIIIEKLDDLIFLKLWNIKKIISVIK